MKKNNEYEVEVVFSTSVFVTVMAEDADEAMDTAEFEATKLFRRKLNDGALGVSDFDCEAQEP